MPLEFKTVCIVACAALLLACNTGETEPAEAEAVPSQLPVDALEPSKLSQAPDPAPSNAPRGPGKFLLTPAEQGLPPEIAPLAQPWKGDFDGMVERRMVRVLTAYQLGGYFLDGPQEKGLTYDLAKMFETFLNERLGTGHVKLHVVIIPVDFDQLMQGLVQGYGDIAAAGLSITDERDAMVDFSDPLSREVKEVIVTGPASPALRGIDDLAGKTVYAKPGSSYLESLAELNREFAGRGLEPVDVREPPAVLQDEEVLEMVGTGMLPMVVMDDFKARFWADIFDQLEVREDLVVRGGRRIAWAFREDSPLLAKQINDFLAQHKQGTLMGNILLKRYLKDTKWASNALASEDFGRFQATIDLFKRYSGQYGFDYLMMAAQGYQESRLDQSVRSSAGAIGIMQLLPSTAADPNVGIPNIQTAEANIHAGVKYLDFIRQRYFSDPELDAMNSALFSFAAYNAGPARVSGLRRKAQEAGLDPNKWFNNVELMAAKEIGRETVQYVSNIYKYYFAYRLITDRQGESATGAP